MRCRQYGRHHKAARGHNPFSSPMGEPLGLPSYTKPGRPKGAVREPTRQSRNDHRVWAFGSGQLRGSSGPVTALFHLRKP